MSSSTIPGAPFPTRLDSEGRTVLTDTGLVDYVHVRINGLGVDNPDRGDEIGDLAPDPDAADPVLDNELKRASFTATQLLAVGLGQSAVVSPPANPQPPTVQPIVQDLGYTYDRVGNVTAITDDGAAQAVGVNNDYVRANQAQCFSYDRLDRLLTGFTKPWRPQDHVNSNQPGQA